MEFLRDEVNTLDCLEKEKPEERLPFVFKFKNDSFSVQYNECFEEDKHCSALSFKRSPNGKYNISSYGFQLHVDILHIRFA